MTSFFFLQYFIYKKPNCTDKDTVSLKNNEYKKYDLYNFTLKRSSKSNKRIPKKEYLYSRNK